MCPRWRLIHFIGVALPAFVVDGEDVFGPLDVFYAAVTQVTTEPFCQSGIQLTEFHAQDEHSVSDHKSKVIKPIALTL